MEKEEFITEALKYLPEIPLESDRKIVRDMLEQDYRSGYTLADAVKSAYYTEHVSPQFSEEFACRKIGEIHRKYHPPKERHPPKFEE